MKQHSFFFAFFFTFP
ncbi:pheA operon leader peptide PheL [Cronobacter dublinensis]|nr:pheA operon leader peptide PheL [Mixta mediterraneensis]EKK4082995.1 pheA operon leader peptide PheL [Cronobacter dublinensis]EKK7716959.1 pheA operon leader peptide PheL [Cronobacter dublinensis]ELY2738356.1 pheA operon leader peptide PheL [Cronobacter dublinensis]ELY3774171.1 pheA operon leader peptide PheL [Cronobacter dublinensis]ELY9422870.1 pheA operon leader peptide PheL [Cronobacter dublinensis]